MYQAAFTNCTELKGGDADYDGGCAFAEAWSEAYATACAEAIATAVAEVSTKGAGCQCTISGAALGTAIAHEYVSLCARVEQEVAAEACTFSEDPTQPPTLDSGIGRECFASSAGSLAAKARHTPLAAAAARLLARAAAPPRAAWCRVRCSHAVRAVCTRPRSAGCRRCAAAQQPLRPARKHAAAPCAQPARAGAGSGTGYGAAPPRCRR